MNSVHATIIAYIRSRALDSLAIQLAGWTDQQMLRQMFSNYREGRGLRLTRFGQQLMGSYFKFYKFDLENTLLPAQLLFLDARAKMPYFCDESEIDIYDLAFAVRLRLVNGQVATLMEIDTID
jgi:hypothetical protein